MNRTVQILRGAALAAAFASVTALAEAPKKAPAEKVEAKPEGPVHPALGIALPQSLFVSDANFGRDPFFPNSTRRVPVAPKQEIKSVAPTVDRSSLLTLRGVSGPPERRIALINNMTFVAGEEAAVRTTAGPMKIRVVEVSEKAARIVIEGEQTPRELKLREIISNAIQIHTSKVD